MYIINTSVTTRQEDRHYLAQNMLTKKCGKQSILVKIIKTNITTTSGDLNHPLEGIML